MKGRVFFKYTKKYVLDDVSNNWTKTWVEFNVFYLTLSMLSGDDLNMFE